MVLGLVEGSALARGKSTRKRAERTQQSACRRRRQESMGTVRTAVNKSGAGGKRVCGATAFGGVEPSGERGVATLVSTNGNPGGSAQ